MNFVFYFLMLFSYIVMMLPDIICYHFILFTFRGVFFSFIPSVYLLTLSLYFLLGIITALHI